MNEGKGLMTSVVFLVGLIATGAVNAATYQYDGVVINCSSSGTDQCGGFASLDIGSVVTGIYEIDTLTGDKVTPSDIGNFEIKIFNPALADNTSPVDGVYPDPVDPGTENPSYIINNSKNQGSFALREDATVVSASAENDLSLGSIYLLGNTEQLAGLGIYTDVSDNGLSYLCLAGSESCTTDLVEFQGSFQLVPEVPLPAAAWLFGSAVLGLMAVARRKKA